MNMSGLATAFGELRAQWETNTRLRALLWVVLGIVWLWGLLVAGDLVDAARKQTLAVAEEIERLRPLTREDNRWPERAEDAREQLLALQAMLWTEADVGLAEAAFRDWVRAMATKAGVRVRELSLAAPAAALAPSSGASVAGIAGSAAAIRPLQLRLVADWSRVEVLAFLAEVGRSERVVVVDRFLWRTGGPTSIAEIDLRALTVVSPVTGGAR